MPSLDEPVFAVDVTTSSMKRLRARLVDADEERLELGSREPDDPDSPISTVAVLYDEQRDPLLLPVEPTRDGELLDAIGRLLKLAVLQGVSMTQVAQRLGGELERRLFFERRLPSWAYDGVDARQVPDLPPRLFPVLGHRGARS